MYLFRLFIYRDKHTFIDSRALGVGEGWYIIIIIKSSMIRRIHGLLGAGLKKIRAFLRFLLVHHGSNQIDKAPPFLLCCHDLCAPSSKHQERAFKSSMQQTCSPNRLKEPNSKNYLAHVKKYTYVNHPSQHLRQTFIYSWAQGVGERQNTRLWNLMTIGNKIHSCIPKAAKIERGWWLLEFHSYS